MKKIIFYLLVFLSLKGYAQPANDNCTGAISLGTLPNPAACGGATTGTKKGTVVTVAGTLTGATPENPYSALGPCTGSAGLMSSPANDVWYSFVAPANGPQTTISVTGAAFTPNIACYSGTCGNLSGMGCNVGTAGSGTLTITGNCVAGNTYFIQVSGNTGQTGAFTLKVNSFFNCGDCNTGSSFTATPLPVNGMYQPGQTVQFCYHVSSWDQLNTNWLHGVQFTCGPGWNAASLTPGTPPAACAGSGVWKWLSSGEAGLVNGQTWGPGFYFDLNNDGNTENNFGDNCQGTIAAGKWDFCVSLTVANACNPGADLSVTFNTSGDGESGSWSDNGCNPDPPTSFAAVQSCCPPTVSVTNVLCNGQSTGSATATAVIGGAGNQDPYVFVWTGAATATNTVSVGLVDPLPNLPAGIYTVTVTDKNLCAASTTLTITQPNPITAPVTPHNITCATTGSITTTTATGGTAPYTYAWVGPGAFSSAAQSPTGLTTAGVYTLTVTDHNSCTFTTTATVAQTGTITVTVNNPSICLGTTATLTAAGGTTYSWTAGLSSTTGTSVTGSPGTTTSYTVIGTTGTCTNSAVATITIAPSLSITVNSPTTCSGVSTTLTASGGTTYSWTPATNLSATIGTSVTVNNPTTLTIYTVTGNTGGCTGTATSTVTIAPSLSITVNSPTTCSGVSTTLTASGGTTYSWTPATNLSATTGASVTVNNPTTLTIYTVTGNTGGCTGTATSTVSIAPSLSITVNNATICAGTSTVLTANGGTTYSWTPAAGLSATTGSTVTATPAATTTYVVTGNTGGCTGTATSVVTVSPNPTVTVLSTSVCAGNPGTITASGATTYSWNTGATTASITQTPAGTTNFTVTGTTATCTNTAVGTVSVSASVTLTVNDPIICIGSTTTLTASGATTYTWNTGSSAASIAVSPTVTTVFTASGTQNGCIGSNSGTVTVVSSPTVTVSSATICVGGGDSLTAMGASHYTWTPVTGLNPTTTATVFANPVLTTTYTVVGAAGTCTTSSTGVVTVNPLPTITATSGTICVGQQTATLTASGGITYTWTPATGLTPTTGSVVTANPLATQSYTITGTDANGCVNTGNTSVTVHNLPTITATSGTICLGQQTANLTAGGGSTYTWTPATGLTPTTGSLVAANPPATQSYTITSTDANGCVNTGNTNVLVNSLPNVTATSTSVCPGNAGTITAGGASTYTWSTPGTGANLTQSPATTTSYTVSGTDANTCTNTAVGSIAISPSPTVTVNNAAICLGQQTATLTANGAVSYVWNPTTGLTPSTGSVVVANPASTTVYTVTGSVGTCTTSAISTVTVNPLPIITATSGTICVGQQTATLTASGASIYVWAPATGLTPTTGSVVAANPSTPQNYTITGTDGNGCVNTGNASVLVNSLPNVTSTSTSVCPGDAGTITAAGASTYTWNTPFVGANLTQTPASTTNYTVVGTDANGCLNGAVGTITVYNAFGISVNSAAICAAGQQTATLTATGASTYIWNPATGLSASTGSVVTTIPSATNQVYTITGTSAVGSCTASTTSTLTVNPLPTITATSGTICVGQQTATLTASGASTYVWAPTTGLTPTTGSVVAANPSATQNYTITGTDANNCVNTGTTSVLVNAVPIVSATSATICIGQTATLTASGASTYNWTSSAGGAPVGLTSLNPSNANMAANPTTTQGYIVIGTDANSCVGVGVSQVTVNALPVVSATSSTICLGQQTATLTASGASTYTWNPSNTLSLGTGATVEGFPTVNTIYNITGSNTSGCVSTATTSITVIPLPTVHTNTVSPECVPLTTTFTATPSPLAGAYTYNWTLGNGQTSILVNPTTTYTNASNYTVKVIITDANGCTASASTVVNVLSIPIADFDYGPQPVSILSPEVQFTNESTPGLPIHNWNFGDALCPASTNTSSVNNPSHTYSEVGTYSVTLTVSTANGCSATVVKPIVINEDYAIYVPNAFSPNSDGKNEFFKAEGEGFTDFKLYIFDRWGLLIFYSEDINKGWDGTIEGKGGNIVQQDVYVWKIELKDYQNTNRNLHGSVTLLK